jgi:hypothetical protein
VGKIDGELDRFAGCACAVEYWRLRCADCHDVTSSYLVGFCGVREPKSEERRSIVSDLAPAFYKLPVLRVPRCLSRGITKFAETDGSSGTS